MNDVRLEPEQVPARAELLLAAELGEDAPGGPSTPRTGTTRTTPPPRPS